MTMMTSDKGLFGNWGEFVLRSFVFVYYSKSPGEILCAFPTFYHSIFRLSDFVSPKPRRKVGEDRLQHCYGESMPAFVPLERDFGEAKADRVYSERSRRVGFATAPRSLPVGRQGCWAPRTLRGSGRTARFSAETRGFEPLVRFHAQSLSKRSRSTAPARLRLSFTMSEQVFHSPRSRESNGAPGRT